MIIMIIIIVVILLGFYDRNQNAATKQMHFAINSLGVDDSTHPPATIHSTEEGEKRGRPVFIYTKGRLADGWGKESDGTASLGFVSSLLDMVMGRRPFKIVDLTNQRAKWSAKTRDTRTEKSKICKATVDALILWQNLRSRTFTVPSSVFRTDRGGGGCFLGHALWVSEPQQRWIATLEI